MQPLLLEMPKYASILFSSLISYSLSCIANSGILSFSKVNNSSVTKQCS